MTTPKEHPRLSFQEAFELIPLADETATSHKFMSRQPAWAPGGELPWHTLGVSHKQLSRGAYGAVVYAQAPYAASKVIEAQDEDGRSGKRAKFGIHSIQAVFTNPGLVDRPFVFDVSTIHAGRSFSTCSINVRQPTQPSSISSGPFPISDAQLPLGNVCLTSITTFKRAVPSPVDHQPPASPQERFADILSSRLPTEWDECPQADIDSIRAIFPRPGHGAFPVLDMYKVDMTPHNAPLPLPLRRELLLYRLLHPLPEADTNAHILCHAFEADRNGLLMLGNHLGYGHDLGPVASLTYSFYVHVNAEEAVMRGDGFWVQEVSFPRVSAGRGLMESRIWSPEGVLVASGFQDGIILPGNGEAKL